MDRKLIFNNDLLINLTSDFNDLLENMEGFSFVIWTEIPEDYTRSYYDNEQLINPTIESFDTWQIRLSKRSNPIYSVALLNNQVISSVFGAGLNFERTMNLWATKPEFRRRGIGKIVLLNFIIHCFENNPNIPIKAWDITSQEVDNVLVDLGFI